DGKGKILSKKISYNPYDPPLGVRVKFGLMDLAAGILSRLRSRRGADEVMPPVSGAMALKH
ncbi:hypothetical protein HYR69_00050, partial [Candidatus Sumerlaeota bacterium]|nr:hypothetical protein [Candidatus Sumerlaeota bacterium]